MFIVVESGATKTAWRAVCEDGSVRAVQTAGLSPTCLDLEHTQDIVRKAIPELNPEGKHIDEIFFYGAGLVSPQSCAPIEEALQMWCPLANVHFYSDILAAARALFGDGSGVVAIMGTGSNSCLYQNGEIVRNIRPGGFILGDEGSGAALGKAFIADYIKDMLPEKLGKEFEQEYGLDYQTIVRKVYREPAPSAFLASFAPFLVGRMQDEYVSGLIEKCLEEFVTRSLARYGTCRQVGVVGSFGCACEEYLRRIGERQGLEFTVFLKSPIDRLVEYHTK